jgi:hypothetical protein
MANIAHSLMIKYGLAGHPSESRIADWVTRTQTYINRGFDAEKAGLEAARQIFPDFNSHVYASQADTIMALLAQARNK